MKAGLQIPNNNIFQGQLGIDNIEFLQTGFRTLEMSSLDELQLNHPYYYHEVNVTCVAKYLNDIP